MPVILATWEAEIRRTAVQGQKIDLETLFSKITRAKWAGGMAQMVQCKAMSSSPSPVKKKKKRFEKHTLLDLLIPFSYQNTSDEVRSHSSGRTTT
jgi:hypothetical protein